MAGNRRRRGEGTLQTRKRTNRNGRKVPCAWRPRVPLGGGKHQYGSWHATEADAEAERRAMLADRDRGTLAAPSAVTVGDMLAERQAGKAHLAVNTLHQYELAIAHLRDLHPIPLSKLTTSAVKAMLARWEKDDVGQRFREVGFRLLAEAVRVGQARGFVTASPLAEVPRPKAKRRDEDKYDPFTADEMRAICEAAVGLRYAALWPVLFATGLRIGEALGLRPEDVDLTERTARIEQACKMERGSPVVGRLKTKRSRRTVPLTEAACAALTDHLAERLAEGNGGADLLFCSPRGSLPQHNNVRARSWYPALERAGVRPRNPHQTRHTFATLALNAGAPVTAIAACMGDTVATVTRTYAHVVPNTAKLAVAAMETAMGEGGEPHGNRRISGR
ncbi:tyrosine recombinase XerC [Alienimonas sp. DA493]|uniref:site-specific integrase n=1 Tax=Alienimonas sp. DA493 TaxID=3373605 RepID=UPI003754CF7F